MVTGLQEFKTNWVAALRSGEYKQGHRALHLGDTFCCLGVACDILSPTRWRAGAKDAFLYGNRRQYPSPAVARQLGIDEDFMLYLANMNDVGCSFSQIADYIEDFWEV